MEALGLVRAEEPISEDFPVERYYQNVSIRFTDDGQMVFSKGSKAFIFWRSRTPPHIPDGAFVFHYLKPDQFRDYVASQGEDIPNDLDKKGFYFGVPRLRTLLHKRDHYFSHLPHSEGGTEWVNYLFIQNQKSGKSHFAFFDHGLHRGAWWWLRWYFPGNNLISAGKVGFAVRVNDERKVHYQPKAVWGGGSVRGMPLPNDQIASQVEQAYRDLFRVAENEPVSLEGFGHD